MRAAKGRNAEERSQWGALSRGLCFSAHDRWGCAHKSCWFDWAKIEPVTNCDRFSAASGPTLATLGVHRAWGADGNQRTSRRDGDTHERAIAWAGDC